MALVATKQEPFVAVPVASVFAVQAAPTTFNQSAYNETGLVNLDRSVTSHCAIAKRNAKRRAEVTYILNY